MKKPSTNVILALFSQPGAFVNTKGRLLIVLCICILGFNFNGFSAPQAPQNEDTSGYRYLRLDILEDVSDKKMIISEINWLVGTDAYPQTKFSAPTPKVKAPGTRNQAAAFRAYDGATGSAKTVWIPNNPNFPFSIVIDLGENLAINPTGIQIASDIRNRAIGAFSCQGSMDGVNWTTLYTKSGLTPSDWKNGLFKTFDFPDAEAPTAPTGLAASNISANSLTLNWEASTDNIGVTSYEVFEGSASIGTTTATSLELSDLECGQAYSFSVVAKDAAGNSSTASDAFEVSTSECSGYRYLRLTILGSTTTYTVWTNDINWLVGAEKFPKVRATAASTNIITEQNPANAWKAYDGDMGSSLWNPETDEYPYSITIDLGEQGAISPTGIQIGIEWNGRAMSGFVCEGSNDTTNWTSLYSTSGLTESDWQRDAYNPFFFEGFEDTEAPTAPSNLAVSNIGQNSFTLSWDASTDDVGVEMYEVFAGTESKGTTTATTMEVTGMPCNTSFEMTVKALDITEKASEASDALMVETLECEISDENLISNGEFDDGKTGWSTIFHSPAAGSFEVVTDANMSGPNAAKIAIDNGGANWQIELFTVFDLQNGKTYDISFRAKAEADRSAQVTFQRGSDPYNNYWQETVNLSTSMQTFGPFRWTSNIGDAATRLNFRLGGSDADLWLDDIVVREVVLSGDTEPPTAPQNVVASDISEGSLLLTWDASTDNTEVARYEVFANFISKGNTTDTFMELTGLDCDGAYSLVVKAIDLDGNVSESSEAVAISTSACTSGGESKNASLAMNMSSPRSWNSEFAFTNLAHYSLAWMPVETAPDYGNRIPVEELTPDRYLQPGATGRLTVFWDLEPAYIATGDYVFTYEGTAEVALSSFSSNGISSISNEPGRIVVNIPTLTNRVFLYFDVTSNSTSDPISNISFRELAREHSTDIFRPEFVDDYDDLKAFRFMDWGQVNNSVVSAWDEYPADSSLLQTGGVSYNYMISLANQTGMDAWFCLPLLADDDYIRQFAAKVKNELNPDLKIYLELSNEVWNSGFAATAQAAQKARELGISNTGNNKQDAGYYYGYRSAQLGNIFREELSGESNMRDFTQVIAWQAVDSWSFENMVLPGYRIIMGEEAVPEAVAIAPYFGGGMAGSNASIVETWTVEQIMEQLKFGTYSDILPGKSSIELAHAINNMKTYKGIVEKYDIPEFMGYEAGQHMVGSNSTLVALFQEANRDRGMYDLYLAYLNEWRNMGGDLFAIFASTSRYANSGSWGWKEFPAQTREEAPKYDAILTWNSTYGSPVARTSAMTSAAPIEKQLSSVEKELVIYPNPAGNGFITINFDRASGNRFSISNLNGKTYWTETVDRESTTISLDRFKAGTYIFKVNGIARKVIIR